jgi:hypothetical protein
MSEAKPKHAPDSLKYQWRLLGLVMRADWATSLDKSVAYEVVDNYRKDRGDSRASLRYLEKATGATRPNIIASLRRLVERGPFSVALQGGGTRPTAYALHFDKVAENASGIVDDTASSDFPSGIVGDTSVVSQAIPLEDASGIVGNTESVLLVDGLQAGLLDRMNDTRPPSAPPLAGGLAATAAGGTAVEELQHSQADATDAEPTFEALWRAYDYAKGKKEARTAWNALPPEVDKAAVIEAAKAWQASWAAQGKPDAPRKHLATWLREERYDEEAPKGFTKVERGKSVSKAKPGGKREFGIGANIKHFTIVGHETDGSPFAEFFETFTFRADDGQEFSKRMHVVSATAEFAEGADVELKNALHNAAFGKGNIQEDFVGRVVGACDDKGLCFFDVGQPAAAPEWIGDVDRLAPFGTFPAKVLDSSCEWNEHGQFVTLMLDITDCSGGMAINRQVNHTFDLESGKGRAFLASICRAVGITSIEDTDVLHGKVLECTITDSGAISYAALQQEAA